MGDVEIVPAGDFSHDPDVLRQRKALELVRVNLEIRTLRKDVQAMVGKH